MSKIIISLICFGTILCSFSQNNSRYSVAINLNYKHYSIRNDKYSVDHENYLNYGASVLFSKKLSDRVKLGIGLDYMTKNFFYLSTPSSGNDYFTKQDHLIKYLNIPILVSVNFFQKNEFKVSVVNGIISNNIINYDVIRYFQNKSQENLLGVDSEQKMGFSYHLGLEFSYSLSDKIILNAMSCINYKFAMDYNRDIRPYYYVLLDDRFLWGLGLGVEYNIFRK